LGLAPAGAAVRPLWRTGRLRVGVIGCGGRGTGAAINCLEASPDTEIVALGDAFQDRLVGARNELGKSGEGLEERARVADDRCFVGFDAYQKVLALGDIDIVILATPPGFRAKHFEAAVAAGKHVFMEKPVAVDPAGVRTVIAAAKQAQAKGLSVVAGTQRRHEKSYLETMAKLKDGAIGKIVSARCFWNQGGLWMNKRQAAWSDVEWQLRNWLYFTWLSGDHICEQHVHNIDVVNWALNATPVRCVALGGRQVRTDPAYGHIFDHFAVLYEYPREVFVTSMCRQIEGCSSAVEEGFTGVDGTCVTSPGRGEIRGKTSWKFAGENPNPYAEEHRALIEAIQGNKPINEGVRIAESTLTAIMGRMSAYTGKSVTWDQAMKSTLDLWPGKVELGSMPTPEVAVPGKTALV
jgi:predicted dehydrogenase